MGLSDGAFFMIKHTPLPNGNQPNFEPHLPNGSGRYIVALSLCHVRKPNSFEKFTIQLLNNKFHGLSCSGGHHSLLFDLEFKKIAGRNWSERHLMVIRTPYDSTLYQ